jgi:O-acetyl-ADP-ribose deacetylase (regulator of RNase III)
MTAVSSQMRLSVSSRSDDYRLTMGCGGSAAIRRAAGSALAQDTAKAVPRKAGDVVLTTAGALPSPYVFHVVIGPGDFVRGK